MANSTPEQVKVSMDAWIQWADDAKKKVGFEWGMPLQAAGNITPQAVIESQSQAGGYSMMEGDKDTIAELLKSHPHLRESGNSIDLLELMSMPGLETSENK
jgi:hypothetical protein